tara:strand:- start:111 stop:341 length:231 start_codon:yes stop_codon:yes gene_type:complete
MEKTITVTLLMEQEELGLYGDYAEVEVTYEDGIVTDMTLNDKDIIHLLDTYSEDIFNAIHDNEINLPKLERDENEI